MDRCRNSGESSQRREPVRRERVSGKKIKVCEKVEKVAKHCVFPMFCGCGGSNERSKIARHCARSRFGVRSNFGSWDVEKVHVTVARSTFRSKQCTSTEATKLRCSKSARRCGAKHMSKSKCKKHTIVGALLEVELFKSCARLWGEAHFKTNVLKTSVSEQFWNLRCSKCTWLWREARVEVKLLKTFQPRGTFEGWAVEQVHAAVANHISKSKCR